MRCSVRHASAKSTFNSNTSCPHKSHVNLVCLALEHSDVFIAGGPYVDCPPLLLERRGISILLGKDLQLYLSCSLHSSMHANDACQSVPGQTSNLARARDRCGGIEDVALRPC